jgi:FkbM family methyltransferase
MPSFTDYLLRAVGHLPLPRVRGVVWRLDRLLKRQPFGDFEVDFDGLRYRGRLDDAIDWNLFFFGSYSPQELDFLATAARLLGGTASGVTYFDVGANVGQHALFMSRRVAQVVAFEPSCSARERFAANVALNAIDNLLLFPVALGDSNSQGQLGSGFEGNSGSRSLTWTLREDKMETVEIRRGDDLVRAEGLPRLDILKLDVEGYEKRALIGLRETLFADRPVILMELIGRGEKSGFRDENELHASLYPEHDLFTLLGYRRAKLTRFDWNSEALVCLPRERIGAFRSILPRDEEARLQTWGCGDKTSAPTAADGEDD